MIYFSVSLGILEILNSHCLLKSEKYCRKIFVEQLAFGCILRDTHSPILSSPIRGSYLFALIELHILWYSFTILSVWSLPWERVLAVSSFPNNLFTSGLLHVTHSPKHSQCDHHKQILSIVTLMNFLLVYRDLQEKDTLFSIPEQALHDFVTHGRVCLVRMEILVLGFPGQRTLWGALELLLE